MQRPHTHTLGRFQHNNQNSFEQQKHKQKNLAGGVSMETLLTSTHQTSSGTSSVTSSDYHGNLFINKSHAPPCFVCRAVMSHKKRNKQCDELRTIIKVSQCGHWGRGRQCKTDGSTLSPDIINIVDGQNK